MHIPFNMSALHGRELEYIFQSITSGQIAGDQTFSKKCQNLLENTIDVPRALVTTSCTHALEIAALLLKIHPGDEVIVPSFTFVSTPNAFVMHGARPVFCDIRPDTLNLDESKLESLITSNTKAIIVVHYAGVACEMDTIMEIASRHNIPVVEDNAHGLFGKYKGRWLGTFGCLATLSFHETKNITCGEGGALLVNDPGFVERTEIIREKGTNRTKYFRGQIDKYSWVDLGSSYVMSDILAAFLFAQLETWKTIQGKRSLLWRRYHEGLASWCNENNVLQPHVPESSEQAWHMYYLILPSLSERQAFIQHLRTLNIHAAFHYLPLHLSPYASRWGGQIGDCPVTESLSDRLVRLPFYNLMDESTQSCVIDAIRQFKVRDQELTIPAAVCG
jgi:dTDP-4-amino-4,6-dideoxygalactose transaminase